MRRPWRWWAVRIAIVVAILAAFAALGLFLADVYPQHASG